MGSCFGRCEGRCGGCWRDSVCILPTYNDCCPDKFDNCPTTINPFSAGFSPVVNKKKILKQRHQRPQKPEKQHHTKIPL